MTILQPNLHAQDAMALWFRIQAFLSLEARLMDDHKLSEWLTLLSDDLRYWMPVVTNKIGRDLGKERSAYGEVAHFDDDKTSMTNRVKRLATGMAWAETPPSRVRHLISNVEIIETFEDQRVRVRSNFLVYRSHLEYDHEIFSGFREDWLRPSGDSWLICRRDITLDQSVVTQKNRRIFF